MARVVNCEYSWRERAFACRMAAQSALNLWQRLRPRTALESRYSLATEKQVCCVASYLMFTLARYSFYGRACPRCVSPQVSLRGAQQTATRTMSHPRFQLCEVKSGTLDLSGLRRRVGSLPLLQIVAFTPVTFMPLDRRTMDLVGRHIRENVVSLSARSGHYLACFLDRPTDPIAMISLASLAGNIYHADRRNRLAPSLDEDGVFGLLAMRDFDLAKAEEETDCDFHITPLHSAAAIHANRPAVLDLLLRLRAEVGGYHFKSFDEDGLTCERETLLSRAVRLRQPAVVEKLLRAKADPTEVGYDFNSYGENPEEDVDVDAIPALVPDGVFHHTARTPLWTAVDVACNYDMREGSDNVRDIVKLLLRYLARPDQCGNVEYHRVVDSDGTRRVIHMTDSSTTPLEIARRACEDVPRDLLELLRSHGMAQKRPRDDDSVECPPNRPRCADQA